MRMRSALLLAGVIVLFFSSPGNAQTTIYSHTFNGGATNINQTAPTIATETAGATSSALWADALPSSMLDANGVVSTASPDSVLLPFTPENGYVYTLTASVTFTGYPGSWIGAGFAENYTDDAGTGEARFADAGVVGYDFAILTESTGTVQYFAGPKASGTIDSATAFFAANTPGTHTLVITLDTTGAQWAISCSIDGKQAGSTYTYTTNPPIGAFGFTQSTLSATAYSDVKWNSISLTANGTRSTTPATATVTFSTPGVPLNPSFVGLSYEKQDMTTSLFTSANRSLINLFSLLGPAVLRIGGGTVDTTNWEATSGTAITPAEVDTFTGFAKALPSNWTTIYGINLETNTPTNAAAEAAYAKNDLGSNLLGFEIGNEPDSYGSSWPYSTYLSNWQTEESSITATVPGWDQGKGSGGWFVDGPDEGYPGINQLNMWIDPFASNESGVASLLTQHFYVGSSGGMEGLLAYPNSTLDTLVTNIAGAAEGNQALGARITEAGSYGSGGELGVSNAFGSALWALDFMFTAAENGVQGVNFHGGDLSPYSPINNNGSTITSVGPEFYAMKMFSLIPQGGSVVPTTVTVNPSTANFTAYGVEASNGLISAVLNNKEVNYTVSTTLNLGSGVSNVELISLTSPNLLDQTYSNGYFNSTNFTLGGASITTSGTWNGGVQQVLTASDGQLTVSVPPATAYLLIPVSAPPPAATPTFSVAAGSYTAAQTVSLADVTPGAAIYYTTDGSTPTTSSTLYTGPITVSGPLGQTVMDTINAIATATGYSASPVASAVYTIDVLPVAASPSFSVAAGTYTTVQTVSLSDSVAGAAIYYTTDGSTPTTNSTLYAGPITVAVSETVNAITVATGYAPSPAASAAYVINLPAPAFTITTSNTTMAVSTHGAGSTTLTITANAAFNGTITFNCSWYVPVGATCQFTPATVTVNALGTTTTTIALTMPPEGAGTIALRRGPGPLPPVAALAGVLCLVGFRKRRRLQMLLLIVIGAVGLSTFSACGSTSTAAQSSAQFLVNGVGSSLPVNSPAGATATSVSESLPLTLTIQ